MSTRVLTSTERQTCVCLTRCEAVVRKAQPLSHPPLHCLHLIPVFELLHLQQRRAVVLHALHVTTATLKETHQLIVHLVAVLHLCRERETLVINYTTTFPRMLSNNLQRKGKCTTLPEVSTMHAG